MQIKTLKTENPFYGLSALLALSQTNPNQSLSNDMLDRAWAECKTDEQKKLFHIVCFSLGDIANRHHNFFGNQKIEQGGRSERLKFQQYVRWLAQHDLDTFAKLLPLIGEYTNMENMFYYQIRSDRKKGRITEIRSIVPTDYTNFINKVTTELAKVILNPSTPEYKHKFLAKFLNIPRFSQRRRGEKKYKMQKATYEKEMFELRFALALSEKCGWEVINYPKNIKFKGLEEYKHEYTKNQEAHLFSSKKILQFKKEEFFRFLDQQPNSARNTIKLRLSRYPQKWGELPSWYTEWMTAKEEAKKQLLNLTAKENLTEAEQKQVIKLTKDSKVNIGAETLYTLIEKIYKDTETKEPILFDQLMEKVSITVPVLPVIDISSSMGINKSRLACTIATTFLLKNPDKTKEPVLFRFNHRADLIYSGAENIETVVGPNRYISTKNKIKVDWLVDKSKPFYENYQNILKFLVPTGSTELISLSEGLKEWIDEKPDQKELRREMINEHQVILIISDGDLNSHYTPKESMTAFQQAMRQYCGWEGVIVVWDINHNEIPANRLKFSDLPNVIHMHGFNPSIISSIFSKINDLDVVDVYTELKSLNELERYAPIKEALS